MNEGKHPDVSQWLSQGWETFKKYPALLIGVTVMMTLIYVILAVLASSVIGMIIYYLFLLLFGPVLWMGWCYICLRAVRGENVVAGDLFAPLSHYGPVWVAYILYGLIVAAGCILLIVPGIIWSLKYGFCTFAVMDKKCGGIEAISFSAKITKGFKGQLFLFVLIELVCGLLSLPFIFGFALMKPFIVMMGLLPFAAMVLVVAPWLGVSLAAAYESLRGHYESKIAEPSLPPNSAI
ncbi:membrane hypothetical protein [Candidatus Zixiibacteriota bacterium]|nr:membrane hypothetical protein [candidate division Zixibacteria bacterium]